jgi:O-antigen ligase
MGIITYCADALSNESTPISRTIKFTIGMLLSLTLGHSSAFLAIFVILMLYAYIKIKPVQRLFSFTFIIAALFLLLFLPQFTDFNAGWRLVYWKHILERSFTDGYLIFGHGFGSAYMTYEQAQYIDRVMHSKNMLDEYFPMTRYLNPPHNSVLTIVFHVGLIPALLFFTPLKKTFTQLFLKKSPADPNILFLVLALLGSLVWILFNVILELPHSSTYFWLVYLTTIFYLKENLSITINYEK